MSPYWSIARKVPSNTTLPQFRSLAYLNDPITMFPTLIQVSTTATNLVTIDFQSGLTGVAAD